MIRVPLISGAPVGMFLVRNPDTGALVAPDSLPTIECWALSYTGGGVLTGLLATSLATGEYLVTLDTITDVEGAAIRSSFYTWVVTTVVGGETRKTLGGVFEVVPHIYRGAVVADAGNTATTFKVALYDGAGASVDPSNSLLLSGLLWSAVDGVAASVGRVDNYNSATDFLTLSAALKATPADNLLFVLLAD
jgi:hypothetical protein